ncbi:MAG: excisionase family DNA-binding protein [Chloroflexi bacterium]|nr:excisionase family DNA-binding protein [Chloroflexota bacterium]
MSDQDTANQAINDDDNDEPLAVSVEEGARLLGLGRSKFYTEVLNGRCESVKIGERRLIPRAGLTAYLEMLREEAKAERYSTPPPGDAE